MMSRGMPRSASEEWWPSGDIDDARSRIFNPETMSIRTQAETADIGTYQHKKNLAEGMMDVALLSANTNQLRYISLVKGHPYYYFSMTFIVFSITLQVLVAIGLLFHSRYNVKDEKDLILANRINNLTIFGVFLIAIVNVFVSAFSVTGKPKM